MGKFSTLTVEISLTPFLFFRKLAKEVFISNKSNEPTAPSPDQIIVPKRRGRKRLLDKQLELEAAEAKEKDNKTAMASLTEKQLSLEKSAEEEPETTSIIKTEEETENNKYVPVFEFLME